jgi:hypothetical protein
MKTLFFVLAALMGGTALAGDCSLPNMNRCFQQFMPQCPKAMFPDLRTPGLEFRMMRPEDVEAIRCRAQVIQGCAIAWMALDNNLCLSPDPVSDDPATDPTLEATPAPQASPSPTPGPESSSFKIYSRSPFADNCIHPDDGTKTDDDGDDNDDDSDPDTDVALK